MSADCELLELAATAAGYESQGMEDGLMYLFGIQNGWNPLTDDGDALRLAVLLSIDVMHRFVGGRRCEALAPGGKVTEVFYQDGCDFYAPTRRAIVRAAAEIGKATS